MEPTVDKPDYTKERIKFETEFFKQLFTLFLLIGSATATLFVRLLNDPPAFINGLLLILGSIAVGLIIGALRAKNKAINKLINDLNREQP